MGRFARFQRSLEELFPERRLYVRSRGRLTSFVLTTPRQLALAGVVAGGALWIGVCTAAMLVSMLSASTADREVARTQAKYERWIADRQARLNSAVAQLNAAGGASETLADSVERRHAALVLLLAEVKGTPGAAQALGPVIARALDGKGAASPVKRVEAIRISQEQILDAADDFARSRADRLRLAFRLAGLTPAAFVPRDGALGGPLIESKDPRALAAVLDVDEDFASRIQAAAVDVSAARALTEAAVRLPFERPTQAGESSGFGVRRDPFTGRPAFHSGLDFAAASMTPVYTAGPGVVSFTGEKPGYGRTVEIDHGRGFKTRYAHLSAIGVKAGQRVALGQRLGATGSTGRSTGPHLHYEVWVNGRAQNPIRFLRAGDLLGG